MKLHFLRYFSVLAEELHFGRAAERLAITQPPLSAAIKALEQEVGAVLLVRNSKRVELTPAGKALLSEARQILERVYRAKEVVAAVKNGQQGRLDIGLSPSLIYRDALSIVDRAQGVMPGVNIVLHEMPLAEQVERLLQGHLDAGFTNGPAPPPRLQALRLADDQFAVCLPEGHKFARRRTIDLRLLANERFIVFSREIGPANHDNVITMFARVGIHPETVHQTRGWLSSMSMVSKGCGVAIVPQSMAQANLGGVQVVPLSDPVTTAPAMLVWNPVKAPAPLQQFLAVAAEAVAGPARGRGKAKRLTPDR
jgi:DNA-binding transcriptional LysR family regulator